jgi:hypothetical protein
MAWNLEEEKDWSLLSGFEQTCAYNQIDTLVSLLCDVPGDSFCFISEPL